MVEKVTTPSNKVLKKVAYLLASGKTPIDHKELKEIK